MNKPLIILILVTLSLSCKKFPEDQALFHINTVKQRLCRQWYLYPELSINNYCPWVTFKPNNELYTNCTESYFSYFIYWKLLDNNQLCIFNNKQSIYYEILRLDWNFLSIKKILQLLT